MQNKLAKIESSALVFLRYALVVMLFLGGAAKWTRDEALGIQVWMSHSPFLAFLYRFLSVQAASIAIGVVELTIAALITCRHWFPRLCMVGSLLSIPMFVITLSFLFTTPHLSSSDSGFLFKDIFLLGISVWSAAEAASALKSSQSSSSQRR